MKKTLLVLIVTLSFSYAKAQMKLGNNPTTTNSNALLELETTNKGLLLPRVALTSTTAFVPLSTHVAGMSVYNTATAGDVTPGYYVNDGSKWVKIIDTNLYTGDGTLMDNRTVTQAANTLAFTSTAINGFSVAGSTFSVDAANNRVGIGTTTPNAKLEVIGSTKTDALQVVDGASAGKVLTSDASGNAAWQTPAKPVTFIPTTPFNSTDITGGNWRKDTEGGGVYKAQLGIFSFTLANASHVMASSIINGGVPCLGCLDDNGGVNNNLRVIGSTYFVIRKADNTIMGTSLAGSSFIERDANGHSGATATPLSLSVANMPAGSYFIDVYYTVNGGPSPWTLFNANSNLVYAPTSMNIQILALPY